MRGGCTIFYGLRRGLCCMHGFVLFLFPYAVYFCRIMSFRSASSSVMSSSYSDG